MKNIMKEFDKYLDGLTQSAAVKKQGIENPMTRAGIDVEVSLAKDRVRKVIARRLPKEIEREKLTGRKMEISKWKMRKFQNDIQTALYPKNIMKKLKQGRLLSYNVDDFAEINPYKYNRMAYDLYKEYVVNKKKMTYNQKVALGNFLKMDLTGLKGGVFNVIKQQAEPISILDREVTQKGNYVKGTLKSKPLEQQASATERYSAV